MAIYRGYSESSGGVDMNDFDEFDDEEDRPNDDEDDDEEEEDDYEEENIQQETEEQAKIQLEKAKVNKILEHM